MTPTRAFWITAAGYAALVAALGSIFLVFTAIAVLGLALAVTVAGSAWLLLRRLGRVAWLAAQRERAQR